MKRFLSKISFTILPVWLLLIGWTAYYNWFVKPQETGDLGSLGKIPFGNVCDEQVVDTMYFNEIGSPEQLANCPTDILTVGDSFSQQKCRSYQNFISSDSMTITNYAPTDVLYLNPFQTAYDLLERGYADSLNTKIMLVECVERYLVPRLRIFSTNGNESDNKQNSLNMFGLKHEPIQQNYSPIIEAKNYFVMRFGLTRKKPVRHEMLSKDLFSGHYSRDLYFYQEDVTWDAEIDSADNQLIIGNLSQLFAKADEKGVRLLVMIASDKYDIYQNFIIDNPYQNKTVNEDLQRITKNDSRILYTKDVFVPMIENGEKDLYYVNDSHWSVKGAMSVGKYLGEIFKSY